MNCKICGEEMRIVPEQVSVDKNNVPIYHRIAYCDRCMKKLDLDDKSTCKDNTKESGHGIIGLILSFFSYILPIGIISAILCIIGMRKKDRKSICGIIGIVICISMMLLGVSDSLSTSNDNSESSTHKSETEIVISKNTEAETELEKDIDSEAEIVIQESEEEYKASCNEYAYKDVLRNPEKYVGEKIKVTIQISSVHEASWLNDTKYYFGYSETDYGWYGNEYAVFDERYDNSLKLLSEDVITVYGEIAEPEYTSSLIVASEELFSIKMRYVDLISE